MHVAAVDGGVVCRAAVVNGQAASSVDGGAICRAAAVNGDSRWAERVLAGAKLLEKGDVKSFGAFMFDSHESSRVWFENSSPELDAIVDFAKEIPEVLGARLSGGGFGGSCVLLVKPEAAEAIEKTINSKYEAKFGERCKISVIKASEGAHVVA